MSCTVTTVEDGYREPRRIAFHIGFARFLDDVFALLADDRVPAHLFGQASAPVDSEPGDLSPEQAAAFAAAIDERTDEDLEWFMWRAVDESNASRSMREALRTVRELAELARYSVDHGGLTFV